MNDEAGHLMSLSKRHIEIDGDMPVRDLLKLLDVPGNSITMLVPRGTVKVKIHSNESGSHESMTFEEKKALARSAIGAWRDLIDLDELERTIYAGRDEDPIKPPVVFD